MDKQAIAWGGALFAKSGKQDVAWVKRFLRNPGELFLSKTYLFER